MKDTGVGDDTITAYLGRLAERTAAPAGGATAAMNAAQALQPMVNRSIAPDVAAAAEAIRAAIATSRTNIEANLSGITDPAARDRLTRVITGTAALEAGAEQVIAAVRARYA